MKMNHTTPAFPRPASEDTTSGSQTDGNRTEVAQEGMTYRMYVAAKTMAALAPTTESMQSAAKWSVSAADALIDALNK